MSLVEAISRFIVGGCLILLVSYIGKTKNPYISGLVVLFPIVTVVGYYFLSLSLKGQELQKVSLVSLYAVPTTIAFLITIYLTINRIQVWQSLFLGAFVWLVVAGVLIIVDKFLLHLM